MKFLSATNQQQSVPHTPLASKQKEGFLNGYKQIEDDSQKSVTNTSYFKALLKQMLKAKIFFIVTCTSFVLSVLWLQQTSRYDPSIVHKKLIQEAIVNVAQDPRYSEIYRKDERLPRGLKYMLLWSGPELAPFSLFTKGQEVFIKYNCTQINCFVTSDRDFFDDITKFDAIAFNGRHMRAKDLPNKRSPRQKYIFVNMESSDNMPVCDAVFDNYFNWTATYRVKSDIQFGYILITDKDGNIVGPQVDMKWPTTYPPISEDLAERLKIKTKAAAWFVSHCNVRSKRKVVVAKLQKALAAYGHKVDIYGACGPLDCPRNNKTYCDNMLEKDYFFYLSFENSFDEDYATEKVLTALQHNAVPIVYGGADYNRFLPPGSYLDARKLNASALAATMDRLMHSPKLYQQYFRWKSLYRFSDPKRESVCDTCAALNNEDMFNRKSEYMKFRKWWLPNYLKRCTN